MKQLIKFILVGMMGLCLSACGENDSKNMNNGSNNGSMNSGSDQSMQNNGKPANGQQGNGHQNMNNGMNNKDATNNSGDTEEEVVIGTEEVQSN